jgi:hypothetical protein
MIRRIFLVAAAAAALILAPTTAMAAYNAPGYTCTVSDPTPAIGAPVTVHMSGADANEAVTLTITSSPASISNDDIQIAGTKALNKTANASGVADFTVTLASAGTYALSMTEASGAVISTQTLTVGSQAAAAAGAAATPKLSFTGFNGMGLAVGGGVLVLAGAGAVLIARRRRSAQVSA